MFLLAMSWQPDYLGGICVVQGTEHLCIDSGYDPRNFEDENDFSEKNFVSVNMLRAILHPGSYKAHELLAGLEHWEQQVAQYTKRKNAAGRKREIPEDSLLAEDKQ